MRGGNRRRTELRVFAEAPRLSLSLSLSLSLLSDALYLLSLCRMCALLLLDQLRERSRALARFRDLIALIRITVVPRETREKYSDDRFPTLCRQEY
jgi:hypothetical protein